jgi:glycosyltransferase involved in cell wall biosynthesis
VRLLIRGHWSHTGFGVVTEALGSRLLGLGVDVRVLAVNHRGEPVKGPLAGRVWPEEALTSYGLKPSVGSITGELWRTLDSDDEWKPDAVLAIADVSGLLGYIQNAIDAWRSVPVYHYCPIEGDNLPPLWRQLWDMFQPVAMSDYGQRVMSDHLARPVPRIYHGVDSDTFRPATMADPLIVDGNHLRSQDDCKRLMGFDPERKMLLRADRNATRKRYETLLRAFVDIARGDPLVDLVLHCRPIDPEGIDLWQEILRMPEDVRDRVKFTNAHDTFKGLSRDGLAALYNAADVYISTTGGEGFGLTLAEAMACGTPVVCTDWAAEREVVGDGGILVPPLIDRYGEPVRDHSKFGMDWALPDAKGFVEPTLRLLSKPAQRRAIGALGRAHVKRSFSWDTAAAEFLDLFTEPLEAAA